MHLKPSHKTWLTPVTAVSFTAVAISGTLMLFHVKLGSVKEMHEWMGLVLAVAGTLHLILNFQAFWSYLAQRKAVVALVGTLVLTAALVAAGAMAGPGHGRQPPPGSSSVPH